MTDRYAVIGNPIAHSRSPAIHTAFARETGQDLVYDALLSPLDDFSGTVARLRADGGRGANVTVPFKYEAWQLATERSGYATLARAVNTLVFEGDAIVGHNTDGIGLVADIERHLEFSIAGRRVLLLGAGGASYGVVPTLVARSPSLLHVANRTAARAGELVSHFIANGLGDAATLSAGGYDALPSAGYDLVINATSAGLAGERLPLPASVFARDALAYEMVYGKDTPFMQQAREAGARVSDGLGMLVEQAAEAFWLWRGVRPGTAPVIRAIRASLAQA